MSKKLINKPEDVVEEALQGLLLTHPTSLRRIENMHVVLRADFEALKEHSVALLSGGGSGHEPAHAGFIGDGMLTGAVLGGVFASPSIASILAAIRAVTGPRGCLLIVKNYTGDRLNFGMAREQALAEGLKVDMVFVADDCALPKEKGITGRRGVAGTVFVHKVAGAAAAAGLSLEEVKAEAEACAHDMGSLGIALTTCTVPGTAPSTRLAGDLIEIGMGIHGEPGLEQRGMRSADELAQAMVDAILRSGYVSVGPQQRVVILLNNLGATPPIEVSIVTRKVVQVLESSPVSLVIDRVFTGPFMTSLDMAGVSLTILKVDESRLSRLSAPTSAPGWLPAPPRCQPLPPPVPQPPTTPSSSLPCASPVSLPTLQHYQAMARCAALSLVTVREELNRLDAVGGDGDCGVTLERGAHKVLELVRCESQPTDASGFVGAVGGCVGASMGGSSGVLLEIFFRAMARALANAPTAGQDGPPLRVWAASFQAGVEALALYGGARVGYRTMLDALAPAAQALQHASDSHDCTAALHKAAAAARVGAESTKSMEALAGRANYVPAQRLQGHADPGAEAVAVVLRAMADGAAQG